MPAKFELYKDKKGAFCFRLKAANGEIILASQGYQRKSNAMNGIESVRRNALDNSRYEVKAAKGGESLGFFPEGTFRKERGVGHFRPGAFVAAVRGEVPVVPVAISGTRYMMPSGRLLPRPNKLRIDILPAIAPGDAEFTDARALAETARQRILMVLDEPDLVPASGAAAKRATN